MQSKKDASIFVILEFGSLLSERLELINWHIGVVSLWSKIVSMLCINFCGLRLHLLKTCISISRNHFEMENNVDIDNLHVALALQERCNRISWHNGVSLWSKMNNVC